MDECPNCGGEIYDNRQKVNGGWKGPLFKCKDKEGCGWVKWPPKGQKGGGKNGGPPKPTGPLAPVYGEAMEIAARAVRHYLGDKALPADIIAAAATLFIQASQSGRPIKVAKKAPPKPPPQPEPEDYPDEGLTAADDSELPF